MKRFLLLCKISFILLAGCGGPFGTWQLQDNPIAEINNGSGENYESVTYDGVVFQIERSGAHPSISWPVGPNRDAAFGRRFADSISYEDIDTLKGTRYTFVKECEGVVRAGDKYSGPMEWAATLRVLQLSDMETMYPFRDVDMNGRKFRTFVVVASSLQPAGNFSHLIVQRTNKRDDIRYCIDLDSAE